MLRDRIEQRLIEHFGKRADVCAVYLFGSRAAGTEHSDSDIDVGVLYFQAPPAKLTGTPFRDEAELAEALGAPVQVVVLNTAPADLVHRILKAQRLLHDKEPSFRVRFEVKRRNEYFDLKPILDLYRRKSA
jgi:predicted nucleotidyltransferase